MIAHLDYETYSPADLKKYGAYRYASDPETEILLAAVRIDDGPVHVWDRYATEEQNFAAMELLELISSDSTVLVYSHNAPFEIAISKYLWEKTFGFPQPKLEQWRDTAAFCRMTAIPSSLKDAAEFLKLTDQKDPIGTALINTFSKPRSTKSRGSFRNLPTDGTKVTVSGKKMPVEEAWELFRRYNVKDVEVETQIHSRLRKVEGDFTGNVLESFQMDLRMNDRGVPVNVAAVERAEAILEEYTVRLGTEFQSLTGLNFTQRDKTLTWFRERGYPASDLRAGTVARILTWVESDEDEEGDDIGEELDASAMTEEARRALEVRSLLTYAAVKKLPTMRQAACPDGRIRGVISWWGADRTGRSSSRIVQLQNLKRAVVKDTHSIYRGISDGSMDLETLEFIHGDPMRCIASCIRHFVDPGEGNQLLSVDYSQIEARVLPWLAGHEELLQAFREGKDLYRVTANMLWGTDYDEVTKDDRFIAKVASLSLGFMGGWKAFVLMGQVYGKAFDKESAVAVVKAYRSANEPIKKFWKAMGDAALQAMDTPNVWCPATPKVKFILTRRLGFPVLLMKLPSGRYLSYPEPQVRTVYRIKDHETEEWEEIPRHRALDHMGDKRDGVWVTSELSYYGKVKGKAMWGRVRTHSGVLTENVVQATAGDLMWNGCLSSEKAGYELLFPVHDELVTNYHPERGESAEDLAAHMTVAPAWAADFPIAAVGGIQEFYSKD